MTAKEIYESIDLSQLPKESADKLRKVEKATEGFTIESDKVNNFMTSVYNKIKQSKPTALKNLKVEEKVTKTEVKKGNTTQVVEDLEYKVKGKKKVTKKTPTPSEPKKSTFLGEVKKRKKKGEAWEDAKARVKKELDEERAKAKADAEKVVSKTSQALKNLEKMLRDDPKLAGYPRTYGKQSKKIDAAKDAKIKARPAGKRVSKKGHKNQYGESKGGRVYWENRDNRSDRYAPDFPNKVFLEVGGELDDLGFPMGHTFLVVEVSPSGDKKLIKKTTDYITALTSSAVARGMKSSKDARVVIVDMEEKKVIHEAFEAGGEITITPTQLINNPDALVGTTSMTELFECGGVTAYQEGGEVFVTPYPLTNAGSGDYVAGSNTMSNMFEDGGQVDWLGNKKVISVPFNGKTINFKVSVDETADEGEFYVFDSKTMKDDDLVEDLDLIGMPGEPSPVMMVIKNFLEGKMKGVKFEEVKGYYADGYGALRVEGSLKKVPEKFENEFFTFSNLTWYKDGMFGEPVEKLLPQGVGRGLAEGAYNYTLIGKMSPKKKFRELTKMPQKVFSKMTLYFFINSNGNLNDTREEAEVWVFIKDHEGKGQHFFEPFYLNEVPDEVIEPLIDGEDEIFEAIEELREKYGLWSDDFKSYAKGGLNRVGPNGLKRFNHKIGDLHDDLEDAKMSIDETQEFLQDIYGKDITYQDRLKYQYAKGGKLDWLDNQDEVEVKIGRKTILFDVVEFDDVYVFDPASEQDEDKVDDLMEKNENAVVDGLLRFLRKNAKGVAFSHDENHGGSGFAFKTDEKMESGGTIVAADPSAAMEDLNQTYGFESVYEKGGRLGFEGLAKKVAKRYEGKPVKAKYQKEYGKTYSKEEAMEVGRKVAAKVYGQQQANMKKMAEGGSLEGPYYFFVQNNGDDFIMSIEQGYDSKFVERLISGYSKKPLNKKYLSYLTKQDLINYLERDFDYVQEISEEEAMASKEMQSADAERYQVYRYKSNPNELVIFKGEKLAYFNLKDKDYQYVGDIGWEYNMTKRQFIREESDLEALEPSQYPKDLMDHLKRDGFAKGGSLDFEVSEKMAEMAFGSEAYNAILMGLQQSIKGGRALSSVQAKKLADEFASMAVAEKKAKYSDFNSFPVSFAKGGELKGMKKIRLKKSFSDKYMPSVTHIYFDKSNGKYYFLDFEGDMMELRNTYTLEQLKKEGIISMAKGGSLMGHGLQVGDKIVEDLGSALKVETKDGGVIHVDLASGYRGKDMPLPFAKGGAVGGMTIPEIAKKFDRTTADVFSQLQVGEAHEMEHTGDPKVARKIALDHLAEDLDYYTKLKKIGL